MRTDQLLRSKVEEHIYRLNDHLAAQLCAQLRDQLPAKLHDVCAKLKELDGGVAYQLISAQLFDEEVAI